MSLALSNLKNLLALLGNFADENVEEYRVFRHAGGHWHSAPGPSKFCWSKFVKPNIEDLTESNKSEALDKHCKPCQSHVVMLF